MRKKHLLIIVLILILTIPAIGLANSIMPMSNPTITEATLTIRKASGNLITAKAVVEADTVMDSIGVKSLVIQENDGSGWEPVKGPVTDLKVSVRKNTVTLSFTGTPGYRYRAKGTLYAAKSGYPTYSVAKTSGTVTR